MTQLFDILSLPAAIPTLEYLRKSSETAYRREQLEDIIQECQGNDSSHVLDQFLNSGLIQPYGDRLGISILGRKTSLLAEAINGGDVRDIFRRLQQLRGFEDTYQIVQGRMTNFFFRSLTQRPGCGALYICSPWINPTERELRWLKYAMLEQERRTGSKFDVFVITRPPETWPPGLAGGLEPFENVGAVIYFNSQLHSKLYVREPDQTGRYSLAMVGSQNLTKSNNLELGIRINGDRRLIDQLIAYFMNLASSSTER